MTVDELITKLRGMSLGGYGDAPISIRNAMTDKWYPIASISPDWDLEECVLRIFVEVGEPQIMPNFELTLSEAETRAFHAFMGATNYPVRELAVLACDPCSRWRKEQDDLLHAIWSKLDDTIDKREQNELPHYYHAGDDSPEPA